MSIEQQENVLASVMTFDESETAKLEALVNGRTHVTTESYVWGEFTTAEIAQLRNDGFIITVHDVPALSVPTEVDVYAKTTGKELYIIGLRGPWLWDTELEALDVKPIEKVNDNDYTVSMPGPNVVAVAALYFVYKVEQKTLSARNFQEKE